MNPIRVDRINNLFLFKWFSISAIKAFPLVYILSIGKSINELILWWSLVYVVHEDSARYGLHLHYVRQTFEKLGLGLGYERVFDPHSHQTIGFVIQYKPIHHLTFNLGPGVLIEENSWSTASFSAHLESSWDFELGHIHLGPLFEVAYGPDDLHLSLGLHTVFLFNRGIMINLTNDIETSLPFQSFQVRSL